MSTLPSDAELIAVIKERGVSSVGYLSFYFKVERELLRTQLRRLRTEGRLRSESVKLWDHKNHSWKFVTDWSVAP